MTEAAEVKNPGGPLPERPFVTLSEALTWLAFGQAIESEQLIIRLWANWDAAGMAPPLQDESEDEWKARRAGAKASAALEGQKLDRALIEAAENLLDKACEEKVEMRGQEFRNYLDGRPDIRTERIPAARFHDYRCFDTQNDSFLRCKGLAWERVPGGVELASPHDETNFRHVIVNRDDLAREFPCDRAKSQAVRETLTNDEIDDWIRSTSKTGMKKARAEFMKEPRAKGLSATFENRWNAIKQNKVGRPHNS